MPKAPFAAGRLSRLDDHLPLARLAGLMGVLGLALVVAVSIFLAWTERNRAVEQARREITTAAFALADHAGRLFESADVVLKAAATLTGLEDWDTVAADAELQRQLGSIVDSLPYVGDVWLNDAAGDLRLTTFAFPAPASNSSDRAVFQAMREPDDRLFIGQRIIGRVTGEPTFLLARRLSNPDTTMRGMVSVSAQLKYFNDFWDEIELPLDAHVHLVRSDNVSVLAQHPAEGADVALPAGEVESLRQALAASPTAGEIEIPAEGNEPARMVAYRQVANLPLVLSVDVSRPAVDMAWRRALSSYLPVELTAFFVLLALTLAAFRQARREDEARAVVEAARADLAQANTGLEERVAERTAELREETARLDTLNKVGRALASELDSARLVQTVVEAASTLAGAAYGALFERVPAGREGNPEEVWRLAALTGAPQEAFTRFGLPRATALFEPSFRGQGVVRSDDVMADPRYGSMGGMPDGHLPVRSYLAVSVVSRSGEVLGALLFGHPEPGRFGEREERLLSGFAGQTAVALDNARLFASVLSEVEERRRVQDALKESNDEIQRYAYIVSHDLRAPLVNVMGFTSELEAIKPEIFEAGALGPSDPARLRTEADFDEAIGFIKAAINKMDRLINAILKMSREGRRNLRPEPLAMRDLMQSLVDAQRHQIDAKDATVTIAPDLPALVADRLAVEQIFGNLLDNAVKYLSPERRGTIEVFGERVGADRLRFSVSDNGRGIAPEDHGRVFELFRRSGMQDVAGEGIGLAHVKALVRGMGGKIGVRSEFGRGTTFWVELPATPERAGEAGQGAE